nr:Hpt domain-containing protein [uncultured Cohaesibacter sp.]
MDTQNCSLDLGHLSQQTMGDESLQKQVLSIFIQHMETQMPLLEATDADLSKIAHGIKGSARGIGAWRVATAAEALEKAGGDRAAAIGLLKETIRTTLAEIGTLLERGQKAD